MNKYLFRGTLKAFTLIELLVVVALVAVLIAMIGVASRSAAERAKQVACMSNLRQIDIGLIMWSSEHTNAFLWQVSVTGGGTMELTTNGQAAAQFRAGSNYVRDLSVYRCPTDTTRIAARNYASLTDTNLSYFVSLDSATNSPALILTGDRHLQADGRPVPPGLFTWTTNQVMDWTRELHDKIKSSPVGNLGFADGHVAAVRGRNLNSVFQREELSAKHIAVP